MIRRRKISVTEVLELCYDRIDQVNPKLNAVVAQCRERAIREAADLDAMLAGGALKGPLHGVPFTVADSFDTTGLVSAASAAGRYGFTSAMDATVVARARAAGAILLGKANTPELVLRGERRGTFDFVHGITRNPYSLESSTGSAAGGGAIVASGGAYFHIGMDSGDDNSEGVDCILGSAAVNGIVALKATYGRVPRTGHIIGYGGPYDPFLQTGAMTRRAEDLTLLMEVLGGPDCCDAAMIPAPLGSPCVVDIGSLRIAWYTSVGAAEPTPEIRLLLEQCVGYFAEVGCRVARDQPPRLEELAAVRHEFACAVGRDYFLRTLALHGRKGNSPDQRFDKEQIPSSEFMRYREVLDAIKSEQLAWLERYDLILCPVSAGASPRIGEKRQGAGAFSYTSEYNTTGWPAGTVRAGVSRDAAGLPLGVQVVAQPWRDEVVVAALAYLERKTGGWQSPAICMSAKR